MIDKYITSDFNIDAVVESDRGFNPWVLVQDGVFFFFCGTSRGKGPVIIGYSGIRELADAYNLYVSTFKNERRILFPVLGDLTTCQIVSVVKPSGSAAAPLAGGDKLWGEGIVELSCSHFGKICFFVDI